MRGMAPPSVGMQGATNVCGGMQVTHMFIVYIAADFVWIYMEPDTLPSLHTVILAHHIVTLLLLTFPFRHPEFAHFTCWDGATEINTFFLIARRAIQTKHRFFHLCVAPPLLVPLYHAPLPPSGRHPLLCHGMH